ncbi:apolipoprotein N-acyltransferase [Vibrio sp. WXL210]|uniref:apolipoprotein N-acyltransferase n=1 Tax=Vibrio sp. WXL210 TaxID=3450709 RepID=UPI003EC5C8E5
MSKCLVGLISGIVYAYSYRLGLLGPAILLASLILLFAIGMYNTRIKCAISVWLSFGLGFYLMSLYWVKEYILDEYNTSWVNQLTLILLVLLILSFSYALVPLLLALVRGEQQFILLPVALVCIDIVREYSLLSFPWLQPGYIALNLGLKGWYQTFGSHSISLIFYVLASYIAWLIYSKRCNLRVWLYLSTVLCFFPLSSLALGTLSKTQPIDTAKVRVIHGYFDDASKLSKNDVIQRVDKYVSLSLQKPTPDLVVWPESSVSFPAQEMRPFLGDHFVRLSHKQVSTLWGGFYRQADDIQNAIFSAPDSTPIYFKTKLVPFGEYVPRWFAAWFNDLSLSREFWFSLKTEKQSSYAVNNIVAIFGVCYEALFSDVFRKQIDGSNINLAVLISDMAWTDASWLKKVMLNVAQARAIEIGKSTIHATNAGITAVISPDGKVLSKRDASQTQVLDYNIPLMTGETIFSKFGGVLFQIVLSVILLLTVLRGATFKLINAMKN